MPAVVILNSRQALQPHGALPWIQNTVRAATWVKEQGYSLISSLGLQTYELATYLGAANHIQTQLMLSSNEVPSDEDINRHYRFGAGLPTVRRISGDDVARDVAIVAEADIVIPVSVRPNGNLHRLMQSIGGSKPIVREFETPYTAQQTALAYSLDGVKISSELAHCSGSYLIHWTRSCHAPWPDEPACEYYRDVISSTSYPRSALQTLRRMLRTRLLLASAHHMPKNVRAVSFSELHPLDVIPLIRWRARYRQMSFEPYGIGISKDKALALGIQPVIYHKPVEEKMIPTEVIWRSQSMGQKTDWRTEHEYRHKGDLSLKGLAPSDLIVFCRFRDEAEAIKNETGLRAVSFTNYNSTD